MKRLQIMCCSMDGQIVELIRDIPVGVLVDLVSVTVCEGEPHGPWDVPCGHVGCRRSLDVAEACAEERSRLADRWERAEYDGWAD